VSAEPLVVRGQRLEQRRLAPRPRVAQAPGLEAQRVAPAPARPQRERATPAPATTLVFLHEGLGSCSTWRDFPERLAAACGLAGLVYSRGGYGASDPVALPRPLTYLEDEAQILPHVLDAAGVERAILFGHSDGASIALLHAATGDPRLAALVLEAPHVFVEDCAIEAIAQIREDYLRTDLRSRLARHHGANVDVAFRGWNDAWLDPAFRRWNIEACLPRIRVPILLFQGDADPYGTLRQADAIAAASGGPVRIERLAACGHTPHREREAEVLRTTASFLGALASL